MPRPKRMFHVEYRDFQHGKRILSHHRLSFDVARSVGDLRTNLAHRRGWERDEFQIATRKGMDGPELLLDDEDVVEDVVSPDEMLIVRKSFEGNPSYPTDLIQPVSSLTTTRSTEIDDQNHPIVNVIIEEPIQPTTLEESRREPSPSLEPRLEPDPTPQTSIDHQLSSDCKSNHNNPTDSRRPLAPEDHREARKDSQEQTSEQEDAPEVKLGSELIVDEDLDGTRTKTEDDASGSQHLHLASQDGEETEDTTLAPTSDPGIELLPITQVQPAATQTPNIDPGSPARSVIEHEQKHHGQGLQPTSPKGSPPQLSGVCTALVSSQDSTQETVKSPDPDSDMGARTQESMPGAYNTSPPSIPTTITASLGDPALSLVTEEPRRFHELYMTGKILELHSALRTFLSPYVKMLSYVLVYCLISLALEFAATLLNAIGSPWTIFHRHNPNLNPKEIAGKPLADVIQYFMQRKNAILFTEQTEEETVDAIVHLGRPPSLEIYYDRLQALKGDGVSRVLLATTETDFLTLNPNLIEKKFPRGHKEATAVVRSVALSIDPSVTISCYDTLLDFYLTVEPKSTIIDSLNEFVLKGLHYNAKAHSLGKKGDLPPVSKSTSEKLAVAKEDWEAAT